MDTSGNVVPHHRPRIFILGIHGARHKFQAPACMQLPPKSLKRYLDTEVRGDREINLERLRG
eukprot:12918985-Prorocentrum_lima.AAC.1